MMYKIFLHLPDTTACGYYRALLPYRHCQDTLYHDHKIALTCSDHLDQNEHFDSYIFHRVTYAKFIPFLLEMREKGRQIIWDFDDNLFEVPESSPASRGMDSEAKQNMYFAIKLSNIVTVSTPYLGHSLGHPSKTVVLPNLIDPTDYRPAPLPGMATPPWWNWEKNPDADPLVIMWAGSITHRDDLRPIVRVTKEILDVHKDRVRFVFFGDMPDGVQNIDPHRVTFLPQTPLRYYPAMLRIVRPDIAIAPLVDSEFNRCKSAIKFYEMTLAGATVAASNVGPYHDTIEDGVTGVLVGGGSPRWISALHRLIERDDDRKRMAGAAWRAVHSEHSWDGPGRDVWIDFFRDVAARHGSAN